MHFFIFSEKDTTLYQASGSQNTGLDEILEVRKDISPSGNTVNVSRALIEFDLKSATTESGKYSPHITTLTSPLDAANAFLTNIGPAPTSAAAAAPLFRAVLRENFLASL